MSFTSFEDSSLILRISAAQESFAREISRDLEVSRLAMNRAIAAIAPERVTMIVQAVPGSMDLASAHIPTRDRKSTMLDSPHLSLPPVAFLPEIIQLSWPIRPP